MKENSNNFINPIHCITVEEGELVIVLFTRTTLGKWNLHSKEIARQGQREICFAHNVPGAGEEDLFFFFFFLIIYFESEHEHELGRGRDRGTQRE